MYLRPLPWDGDIDTEPERAVEGGRHVDEPLDPVETQAVPLVIRALGCGVMGGNLTNLLYIRWPFALLDRTVIGVFYAVPDCFSPGDGRGPGRVGKKSGEDIMDLGDHALGYEEPAQSFDSA